MFGKKNEEATLYYLYMMADGEVSYSEEKIFETICKELELNQDERNSVIEKCKELVGDSASVFDVIVKQQIDEQAGREWYGLRDASVLARIVWNLVNLGFADSFFSDEEKKIVNYLKEKWSVNLEVYQEFVDTANTILALKEQKKWIASTFSKSSARDKREKDVDVEIVQLLNDVKLTIKELTM